MRIAFVIHSLEVGGSERQLATLAPALATEGHEVAVFTLRGGGTLERDLRAYGVEHVDVSFKRPWYSPDALLRLARGLRRWGPDIVHSYLAVPNFVVAGLRPVLGRVSIVWGVRAAGEGHTHRLSSLAFSATRIAARVPDLIIANSEPGRRFHIDAGYPSDRIVVIENGIDSTRFHPDAAGRDRVRREWHVTPEAPLVGLVARPDPRKDHETFLRAAGELARESASMRFVCVGGASGPSFAALDKLADDLGLSNRLIWTEGRDDMAAVYSALDVCCLSSLSEGFPNVAAEAMACGTPCVVTDVGAAADIVDGTGVVAPARDAHSLADGVDELLRRMADDGGRLAAEARERIVERYSVARLVKRTLLALEGLTAAAHDTTPTQVFAFGENWQRFLSAIDDRRIDRATSDLAGMLDRKNLEGASFLDVGSGSGLSSLAARRLGASVHSFDADPASAACTTELRRRYDTDPKEWTVETGSVLDRSYLSKLGTFKIVYSWGVLHHTGAMWEAMGNVVDLVAPGGTLFIALYNDQGRRSRFWRALKRLYVGGPRLLRPLAVMASFAVFWAPRLALDTVRGRPFASWRAYGDRRGMSAWHDLIDWAGGYPFEVARPGDVHAFYRERGFMLERLVTQSGSGCNEFVFVRDAPSGPDHVTRSAHGRTSVLGSAPARSLT